MSVSLPNCVILSAKGKGCKKKLQELRESLNKADRVPRLSLTQADNELSAAIGATRRILSSKYPGTGEIETLWKNHATTNFDDAVAKAKAKLEEKEAAIEEEIKEVIDRIRACSVSLSFIIREDLDEDTKRISLNTVSITAEHATNCIEDFGTVVYATMLKYAAIPLTLDPVSKTTVPEQEHEHAIFHALNIISKELIRDLQALGPDFTIPVTSLPSNIAEYLKALPKKNNDDFMNLFSEAHLQFLHSSYFGRQTYKAEKRPFWSALHHTVLANQPKPPAGLSTVMHIQLKQYATNLKN
ncbi:hypothetical protein DFQ28_001937, partial [Apophysomyces sp. BC1034]